MVALVAPYAVDTTFGTTGSSPVCGSRLPLSIEFHLKWYCEGTNERVFLKITALL